MFATILNSFFLNGHIFSYFYWVNICLSGKISIWIDYCLRLNFHAVLVFCMKFVYNNLISDLKKRSVLETFLHFFLQKVKNLQLSHVMGASLALLQRKKVLKIYNFVVGGTNFSAFFLVYQILLIYRKRHIFVCTPCKALALKKALLLIFVLLKTWVSYLGDTV